MLPINATTWPPNQADKPLAVLVSGGVDSSILLAEAVRVYPKVYPIYVRVGSLWEDVEFAHLTRFLAAITTPTLQPIKVLLQPVADLYGPHWSMTGMNVPGADSPDEAVYLPGRNVLLLAKALLWCTMNDVPGLATAPLAANPFPDATPEFYAAFSAAVSLAVNGTVQVIRPYADLSKSEVLRRGRLLPLGETFSCIQPQEGQHCGRCNKCEERRQGFADASLPDPTSYRT